MAASLNKEYFDMQKYMSGPKNLLFPTSNMNNTQFIKAEWIDVD